MSETNPRPRRSVLYMPAANERALEKAKAIPADALIFDLEDAVAPDAKVDARERACAMFAGGGYGKREITIRANGIGTPWHDDDLAAISAAGPDGVVVPKVNSVADVRAIESALERHGAPDRTRIWAMLETPIAMLHAEAICSSCSLWAPTIWPRSCTLSESRVACPCWVASSSACWPPGPLTK
jgi:citrate lyase subunit beta/citryl-CoA lyase